MTWIKQLQTLHRFSPHTDLADATRELRTVCTDSEERVIGMGNNLQQFAQTAQELSEHCQSVVDVLSSDKTLNMIQSKLNNLKQIKLHISEIKIDYDWIHDLLQHLVTHIYEVRAPLKGIEMQVVMLHNFGVSTRTSIAELGERGKEFLSLSDGLREIADAVRSQTIEINDKIPHLDHTANQATAALSDVAIATYEQLNSAITEFIAEIEEFLVERAKFETLSRELAHTFQEISNNVMEVVISLQFHDILRQSLENSCQSLEQLCPPGKKRTGTLFPNYKQIAEVCRLQNQQIHNAYNDFHTAVDNAVNNMERMAQTTEQMVAQTLTLEQVPENLNNITRSLDHKSAIIDEYGDSNEKLVSHLNTVETTIQSILGPIQFMDSMENKMKLLGLNSTIKAIHIGDGGEALIVLSQSIQEVAVGITANSRKVSDLLQAVVSHFKVLSESRQDKKNLVQEMEKELTAESETIKQLHQEVHASMEKLNELGRSLSDALTLTSREATVHNDLLPNIERARKRIRAVQEQASELHRCFGRKSHRSEMLSHLKELGTKYTIHSQRKTHFDLLESLSDGDESIAEERNRALNSTNTETELWADLPDPSAENEFDIPLIDALPTDNTHPQPPAPENSSEGAIAPDTTASASSQDNPEHIFQQRSLKPEDEPADKEEELELDDNIELF